MTGILIVSSDGVPKPRKSWRGEDGNKWQRLNVYGPSLRDRVREALAAATEPAQVVAMQGELLAAPVSSGTRRKLNRMFEARLSELRRKALSL